MKSHIQKIFGLTFILFLLNKFTLRPWVLETTDSAILQNLVYSLPNFCEAVMGVIILTNIAIVARRSFAKLRPVSNAVLCNLATLIAMVYVTTQEYGLHNLGGNNVFDPLDLLASMIGLVLINRVISRTGFKSPSA